MLPYIEILNIEPTISMDEFAKGYIRLDLGAKMLDLSLQKLRESIADGEIPSYSLKHNIMTPVFHQSIREALNHGLDRFGLIHIVGIFEAGQLQLQGPEEGILHSFDALRIHTRDISAYKETKKQVKSEKMPNEEKKLHRKFDVSDPGSDSPDSDPDSDIPGLSGEVEHRQEFLELDQFKLSHDFRLIYHQKNLLYQFTPQMAEVLRLLYLQFQEGVNTVILSNKLILQEVRERLKTDPPSVRAIFKSTGIHPAWTKLIGPQTNGRKGFTKLFPDWRPSEKDFEEALQHRQKRS